MEMLPTLTFMIMQMMIGVMPLLGEINGRVIMVNMMKEDSL